MGYIGNMNACSPPDLPTVMLRSSCEAKVWNNMSCYMAYAHRSQAYLHVNTELVCRTWAACHQLLVARHGGY